MSGPGVSDPFEPYFSRGQVEWALWRRANAKPKPSRSFQTRIKHLLEFDRLTPLERSHSLAFSDEPPGGRGEHSLFSIFDVVCLDMAVRFIELGFKRKEVVLLLRARRERLKHELEAPLAKCFQAAVKALGRKAPHNTWRSDLPVLVWALRRIDAKADPEFVVCRGSKEITSVLASEPQRLVLLDISSGCGLLTSLLLQSPRPRRGPAGT